MYIPTYSACTVYQLTILYHVPLYPAMYVHKLYHVLLYPAILYQILLYTPTNVSTRTILRVFHSIQLCTHTVPDSTVSCYVHKLYHVPLYPAMYTNCTTFHCILLCMYTYCTRFYCILLCTQTVPCSTVSCYVHKLYHVPLYPAMYTNCTTFHCILLCTHTIHKCTH